MPTCPTLRVLSTVAILGATTRLPAQGDDVFRGAPGLLSLPAGNPFGMDMVAKPAGVDATVPPPSPNGYVDFRESAILGGLTTLNIDGISVGLDWILSDLTGRVPLPAPGTGGWSWAAVLFSVSATQLGPEAQAIGNERLLPGGAGGDLFSLLLKGSIIPGTLAPLSSDRVNLAVDSPEISIYSPGQPSEMDAYDLYAAFYLSPGLAPFLPQPPKVYFSLTRTSVLASPVRWGVSAAEWSGATIFVTKWDAATRTWSTPSVYRSPASLTLPSTSDIDALAVDTTHLFDHGGEEVILFSLTGTPLSAGAGAGISFARSGATGRQTYRDQSGMPVEDSIGRGANVDSLCPLDPSRDPLLRGRAFAIPGAPLPGIPGGPGSGTWFTAVPGGPDKLRSVLWSPNCPATPPGLAILVMALPSPFVTLATAVVGPAARLRTSGGVTLRNCPATCELPVPPAFDLSALTLDFYWLDVALPGFTLSAPPPIGERACDAAFALAEGALGGINGSLDVKSVTTATAGAPVSQGFGNVAFQPITHFGREGYRELVNAPGPWTVPQADIDIDRQDRVCQDLRNLNAPHMSLPNGFDLYVCRDAVSPQTFFLAALNRATGSMTRLTGSTVTDLAVGTPISMFRPQFAFSRDGRTGVCVVHDSTSFPTPNVGPPDRIFVFKTNPAETFTNGNNVFDATPPYVQPTLLHTTYNGTLRIGANGFGLVEGEDPGTNPGAAAMWGGPTDGSALWSFIPVPNTGVNRPFYWSYASWRQTAGGTTDVFLNGSDPLNSNTEVDVMAIRNLGTGVPTVVNITAFNTPTQVQTFGNSALGLTNIRAALSPDGNLCAFIIGGNSATSPGNICIARTDGTNAGSVNSFTQGRFGSQIVTFGELWWLSSRYLLFSAGTSSTSGDLYVYDVQSTSVVALTSTGNNLAVRGSFRSENGLGYYFLRGHSTTATGLGTDWKRIDTTALQITDITGNEFSGGQAPSLRPISTVPYTWFPRRNGTTSDLVFTAGRNLGTTSLFSDDELFRFDPEAGTQAVKLTNNNGSSNSTSNIRRIQDVTLSPFGGNLVFAQGVGTSAAMPEDLFLMPIAGGAPVQVSRTPAIGGQGIGGSVCFTQCPPGVVWVQGDNSRTLPTTNTVMLWAGLNPLLAPPLRLTAPPSPAPKEIVLLGATRLNP
jgi:hypothetical protein